MTLELKPTKEDNMHLLRRIERLAMNTWPAETTSPLGPWLLRAAGGVTKRANSIWTAAGEVLPEGDWMEQTETFYRSRGLPVRYHVSEASPSGLDDLLASQGFAKEVPCSVLIAQTDAVLTKTDFTLDCELSLKVQSTADPAWLAVFLELECFEKTKRPFYEKLFATIRPAKAFLSLWSNGHCAAVGAVVAEDGWAGFINIVVHPELRGQRIGQRLLYELAIWSKRQGADGLYLQVVDDNASAHRLYAKAGFSPLYGYHYRCRNI